MKKILFLTFSLFALCSSLQGSNLTWSNSPAILSTATLNASDAQVAIDGSGNVVAVWIENNLVKSSIKTVSGNWTPTATVSGSGASSVNLVVDTNGNATAVWIESGIVKAATKVSTENWKTPVILSNNGASSPSVSIDTTGNIIAAWARNGDIETATKLYDKNWQPHVTISGQAALAPIITIGESGNNAIAFIVWQDIYNNVSAIYSSSKLLTGTWSPPTVISETSHNAANPFATADSNGNAIAIWYAYDMVGNDYSNVIAHSCFYSSLTNAWNAITVLSLPGIRNPATLSAKVAFDSIGNAIALWNNSFDDETFNLESAIKPVNGPWTSTLDLVDSNIYGFAADVSATTFGDTLGLYMFYNGDALMIQSIETNINGCLNNFWSVPVTISRGSNNAFPKIAASLNGNAINAAAVWINFNGIKNEVVASTGFKTLLLPPTNLNVTQGLNNFGVFKEFYNLLTWDASQDPNAVGYAVFRNGVFLGQVDADTLEFVDNNRSLTQSDTYSVTAIDNQQTQSRAVSIDLL